MADRRRRPRRRGRGLGWALHVVPLLAAGAGAQVAGMDGRGRNPRAKHVEAPESFFAPVERPVAVAEVPRALSKMVRLAASIKTAMAAAPTMDSVGQQLMENGLGAPMPEGARGGGRGAGGFGREVVGSRLFDDFDPGSAEHWERISGGFASEACGSVRREALCFDQLATSHLAVTQALSTVGGVTVQFALHLHQEPDADRHDVLLEYQAPGKPWEVLEAYSPDTYDLASPNNPNSFSLAAHNAPALGDAFVLYSVSLPPAGHSHATKIRWRQVPVDVEVSTRRPMWALDNVAVVQGAAPPGVVLTADPAAGGVLAEFSGGVGALEPRHVEVTGGGKVLAVTRAEEGARPGVQAYWIALAEGAAAGETTVQIPSGMVSDAQGNYNRESNPVTIIPGVAKTAPRGVAKRKEEEQEAAGGEGGGGGEGAEGCGASHVRLQERVDALERRVRALEGLFEAAKAMGAKL